MPQNDKTEYLYEWDDGDCDQSARWMAWTVTNKTKRFIFIAAFENRLRIDRQELEREGRAFGGRRTSTKLFYPKPTGQGRVWIAPVWLSDKEQAEEEKRQAALCILDDMK
mgnify:CR=1 FL=1